MFVPTVGLTVFYLSPVMFPSKTTTFPDLYRHRILFASVSPIWPSLTWFLHLHSATNQPHFRLPSSQSHSYSFVLLAEQKLLVFILCPSYSLSVQVMWIPMSKRAKLKACFLSGVINTSHLHRKPGGDNLEVRVQGPHKLRNLPNTFPCSPSSLELWLHF